MDPFFKSHMKQTIDLNPNAKPRFRILWIPSNWYPVYLYMPVFRCLSFTAIIRVKEYEREKNGQVF